MTDDGDAVNGTLAAMARAQQAEWDRRKAQFERVTRTAVPSEDELHRTLLLNMTTAPRIATMRMALIWMQADPNEWAGWYPEECQNVARYWNIGEEA